MQDSTTYGMILHTEDGGETWVRQGQGSSALQGIDVIDLFVLDSSNVWAVCSHNTLIRTTDGGLTWNQVPTPANSLDPDLSSISFADKNTIWISGYQGVIYKSTNAGSSWTVFDPNLFHHAYLQGIHAITPSIIYAAGQDSLFIKGMIAVTYNAGISWDTILLQDDYNHWKWIGMTATNTDNVIIYGQEGHYTISHDNGSTWQNDTVLDPGYGSGDINGLVMVTPLIFWTACDNLVEKTTDGGNSWEKQTAQPIAFSQFMLGIDAINDQTAIAVLHPTTNHNGRIFKTSDGGKT